jgi:abortive infection bacteriophage resistance protein
MSQQRSYNKTPSTIKQQIALLRERGCEVSDTEYAENCLTNINYYRLAHYFAPFKEGNKGRYKKGTTFEDGMRLYEFDRHLRRLIMTFLEEIEIYFRAVVSNFHAMKYGALGYLNGSTYDARHNHASLLSRIERLMELNESEDFVRHHKNKYGGVMPVWAAMELFSFGNITYFYIDMKEADQKELSAKYFDMNYRMVEDHLLCLSDLRNACAHYSRLYKNPFPMTPKGQPDSTLRSYLEIAKDLYPDKEKWENEFDTALSELIRKYKMEDRMDGYGY